MKIQNLKLKDLLDQVAARKPTPGGGAVSAIAGALGASLIEMVAVYSSPKEFERIAVQAESLKKRLLKLADDDCLAYEQVVKTKGSQKAIKKAALVPLQTFKASKEILKLTKICLKKGNKRLVSDAKVAVVLTQAAGKGAKENVMINLKEISDKKFYSKLLQIIS